MKEDTRWIALMLLPALLLAGFVPLSRWKRDGLASALESAMQRSDWPEVTRLIQRGADVNLKTRSGQTFLEMAAAGSNWRIIPLLKQNGAVETPQAHTKVQKRLDNELLAKLKAGQFQEVPELLQAGASPNAKNAKGYSAIWHALTFGGNLAVATALINAGAKPNINDNLFLAIVQDQPAAAEKALRAGANANARDLDGWTMLMWAASQGEPQQVRSLLKHGADPQLKAPTEEGEVVNAYQISLRFRDYALQRGATKKELDGVEDLLMKVTLKTEKQHAATHRRVAPNDAAKLAGAKR